jgi:hypothetical protein
VYRTDAEALQDLARIGAEAPHRSHVVPDRVMP